MDQRVLAHEPHLALFVPDEDALCFYRQILQLSQEYLNPGGDIYLEINPLYADELRSLYLKANWIKTAELIEDMSGKQRFLHAQKG